jgi:sarcosine oxidase subunit gamma
VYRALQSQGLAFDAINGCAAPFGGTTTDAAAAPVTLIDCSALPRTGVRGRGAGAWLESLAVPLPPAPNRAIASGGDWVARLGAEDYLLLGDLRSAPGPCARVAEALANPSAPAPAPTVAPVPRQASHAWFELAGAGARELLARLCAIDLRPRSCRRGDVFQTFLERVSVILICMDEGERARFALLLDGTLAEFMWERLIETGGPGFVRVAGLDALRSAQSA